MEAGSPVILELASAVWRAIDITVCLLQRDVSLVQSTCARCDHVLTFEALANPDPEVSSRGRGHSVTLYPSARTDFCLRICHCFQLVLFH